MTHQNKTKNMLKFQFFSFYTMSSLSSSNLQQTIKTGITIAAAVAGGYALAHMVAAMKAIFKTGNITDSSLHVSTPSSSSSLSTVSLSNTNTNILSTQPNRDFTDKVVLITGASSGIGQMVAKLYAKRGATLIIHYNQNYAGIQQTYNDCLQLGAKHIYIIQCDLTGKSLVNTPINNPDNLPLAAYAAQQLITTAIQKYNRIHILINNAGVYEELPFDNPNTTLSNFCNVWNKTIDLNLNGPAYLAFLVAKHMVQIHNTQYNPYIQNNQNSNNSSLPNEARIGAIVNVGSRGAIRGEPQAWYYGASKAGLHSLSQSMAIALGKYGISITSIAPGFVQTPMAEPVLQSSLGPAIKNQSPWQRVGTVEEVSETILFLSQYWLVPWLTGGIIDCNGASYVH